MNKILSENWFKIFVAVLLVLVFGSIFYFVNSEQQIQKDEDLTNNMKACAAQQPVIEAYYKSNNYSTTSEPNAIISSTNHYNQQTKKCYVEISEIYSNSGPLSSTTYDNTGRA